jgi:two-component system alkaline phosphatase synthesis response regulator PhoP
MLPGLDGWQICREIRKTSQTPIIMLTAKGETFDKVLGLELGADDYITKPFETKEVIARIKAVLRRTAPKQAKVISYGGITLDEGKHTVTVNKTPVSLTLKEYEILKLLIDNPGQVFTREILLSDIWGKDFTGETRTVDVHIGTLRTKLAEAGDLIETVRGVGYKMEEKK